MVVPTKIEKWHGSGNPGNVVSLRYAAFFSIGPMIALISSLDLPPPLESNSSDELSSRFFIKAAPESYATRLLNSNVVGINQMDNLLEKAALNNGVFRRIDETYKKKAPSFKL